MTRYKWHKFTIEIQEKYTDEKVVDEYGLSGCYKYYTLEIYHDELWLQLHPSSGKHTFDTEQEAFEEGSNVLAKLYNDLDFAFKRNVLPKKV